MTASTSSSSTISTSSASSRRLSTPDGEAGAVSRPVTATTVASSRDGNYNDNDCDCSTSTSDESPTDTNTGAAPLNKRFSQRDTSRRQGKHNASAVSSHDHEAQRSNHRYNHNDDNDDNRQRKPQGRGRDRDRVQKPRTVVNCVPSSAGRALSEERELASTSESKHSALSLFEPRPPSSSAMDGIFETMEKKR